MTIKLKSWIVVLLVIITFGNVANAEYRTIAIEVFKGKDQKVLVNIHSEVKTENKKRLTVAQAAAILKESKGWGSSVGVAVVANTVDLSAYIEIISTISKNAWLDLEGISSETGVGYSHIVKHYRIEQGSAYKSTTRSDSPTNNKAISSSGQSSRPDPASNETTNSTQQAAIMVEEIDMAYKKQALRVAEQKLEEMNVPFHERVPTFRTVMIDGVRSLEIRYSNSDPNARAGDWILSFDPNKPIDENPVDIRIWR